MRPERARRESAEKRSSKIRTLGHDEHRSSEISEAETDLATLTGLERLLEALSVWSRKLESRPKLGTYRGSEERIRISSSR